MSQHEYALRVEELRDHNEELQLQIEELKQRLSQYEEVEESSTRSSDEPVSEWAKWPYCWFVNGWNRTAERFHSFHAALQGEKLAQENRRAERRFQEQNGLDNADLHLV